MTTTTKTWLWDEAYDSHSIPSFGNLHQAVPAHWWNTTKPPKPVTVEIGGVPVTAQQITDAVLALKAHKSPTQVKPVLKNIGHPLAHADLNAIRDQEVKADPTLIGPGCRKKAVLRALQRHHSALTGSIPVPAAVTIPAPPVAAPVDAVTPGHQDDPPPGTGTVTFDEHGYAVNHHREAVYRARLDSSLDQCHAVAKAFGAGPDGKLVVGARLPLDEQQHLEWLSAFLSGDLKTCHTIETTVAPPHPVHPGGPGHDATHHVTWQPSVPGEIPAGVRVPGNWSSPHRGSVHGPEVDGYLDAARMQNPTGLGYAYRRSWMRGHLLGDTGLVDRLSREAKKFCETAAARGAATHDRPAPWAPTARSTDPAAYPDTELTHLPVEALYAYTAQHHVAVARDTYCAHLAAAQAHQHTALIDQVLQAVTPTYTFTAVPDTTTLTGYHRKILLRDQYDATWLFKPAPDPDHTFRPETEHEAHLYARRCGYRTAESRLITHDGQYGQAQRMLAVTRDLTGVDVATLTADQLTDIAREHLLDWAIDNDDTHASNIVELGDGTIVGIDKGRAWRYFGGWPGLTADHHAHTNCALTYTALYDAVAAHRIDQTTTDRIYRAVHARALRMQRIPDTDVRDHIARAVAHRPHYKPSHYQKVVAGTPTCAEDLIAAATARKNRLAADMADLWARVYARAGWTPPEVTGILGENNDGARLYAGLLDPDLPAAVQRTKSFGTPTFVAGRDIDDAHLLLWRERHPAGHWLYRGETTLTVHAAVRATAWYTERCKEPTGTLDHSLNVDLAYQLQRAFYCAVTDSSLGAISRLARQRLQVQTNIEIRFKNDPANTVMCRDYLDRIDAAITDIKDGISDNHPGYREVRLYVPPLPEPDGPSTEPFVTLAPSHRPAASLHPAPHLAADGELHLIDATLTNATGNGTGHNGNSYWTRLPTGELVEFRPHDITGVPKATWGMLRFTLNPDLDITDSLRHIDDHFTAIGTPLQPATHTDLELFYWRHLYAIMSNRADSGPIHTDGPYAPLHTRHTLVRVSELRGPQHELSAWHAAFACLTDRGQVDDWTATGAHLPRLLHLDLRRPDQHGGRPHWERFDIPATVWSAVPMPGCVYNSGPAPVIATGAAYSTEARIRALGIWKHGMSSAQDQVYGSSNYVFLRLNREDNKAATLLFSPRVLARTSTFGYDGDNYGRLENRHCNAYFAFTKATSHTNESNECMVKHACSLLDDVEIITAGNQDDKTQIVADLAAVGITHIRGVPVEHRIVIGAADITRRRALAAALRKAG